METKAKKILIVEDELTLLNVLKDEFTQAQFTVFTARDGVEGLAAANRERPDIILIDILMPKMDGISMLKEIRHDPEMQTTPAIILTNLNDNKTIEKALESGAYDFLVKTDWNPRDLVKHVKDKL